MINSSPIYILGGGGHARVVIDAARAGGHDVAGIFDPAMPEGSAVDGILVIGDDQMVAEERFASSVWLNGIGANPDTTARRKLFDRLAGSRRFSIVTHPSAVIATSVELGDGAQIMAGSVLQPGVRIGCNAVINTRASIDHDCIIADHGFVSPGAIICGDVMVDTGAFVGAGAIVLPGISIGAEAIVAAGVVLRRNLAPGERYYGINGR